MNSIADFKRAMKVGTLVHTIFHKEYDLREGRDEAGRPLFKDRDMGVRPVSIIQSNSFAFKTVKKDGTETNSWCDWPKKSEVIFNQDGSVTILQEDGTKVLTYKIL